MKNEKTCICGNNVDENLLDLKKVLRKALKRYAKAYGFNDSMVMNVRQMKQRTATFQMFKSAYDKDPETYERMNEKRKAGEITAQEFDSWAYSWRESLFEQHALDDELVKNLKTLGVKDVILEEYEEYGATYTRGRMFY